MPFKGKDIPHIVIEVNQACNMSCKACYKIRQAYTKSTRLIKDEIDLAVQALTKICSSKTVWAR